MNEPLPPEIRKAIAVEVPPEYRKHPLLAGPFFTLPEQLLQHVVAEVGQDCFDAELLAMEWALSRVCGNHSSRIGFWHGQPINFLLLGPGTAFTSQFFVQEMSRWTKTPYEAQEVLDVAGRRLGWMAEVRRGYCGWLMTNRAFREEHGKIFQDWGDEVAQHGVPNMGPVVRDAKAISGAQLAEGKMEQLLRDFERFFIRWRLDGMPAPFVPQPMGVHLPVVELRPVLGHMRQGGTTFYIPDIFPVPSRDELRQIVEEALRNRNAPEHLAEWFEIVHSDNVAKNQIPRYARIFELQHYMRALYARHATALKRKKSALVLAFSAYLGVSDDTIERDLKFIADRLGADWHGLS